MRGATPGASANVWIGIGARAYAREQGKVAVREERWGLARESELLNLGESCTADCVLLIVCSF